MSLEHLAKQLAAKGRGKDTELVHMDKGELASLEQLARMHGGSLSTNPKTGLPEAGFLSSILPMVAAAAGTILSGGNPMVGAAAGALAGGLTNKQNPGLGAIMGGIGGYTMGGLGEVAEAGADEQAVAGSMDALKQQAVQSANAASSIVGSNPEAIYTDLSQIDATIDPQAAKAAGDAMASGAQGIRDTTSASLSDYANAAKGMSSKQMMGLAAPVLSGMLNQQRQAYSPPGTTPATYYNTAYLGAGKGFAPGVYGSSYLPQGLPGYADGGEVSSPYQNAAPQNAFAQQAALMDPSQLQYMVSNADSPLMQAAAQQELYRRKSRQRTAVQAMASGGIANAYAAGGKFLRGPGDGVSDSIPAVIHGQKPQRAALADGEFVLPARIVSEIGNGSSEAGARKLYAMMDRIQKRRGHTIKNVAKDTKAEKLLPA